MAERDSERRPARAQLWLGPGRRARETGALLTTLASLDAEGVARHEPPSALGLADLEELLAQRALEGLLILEAARVPAEDIGFVRRFLERHPARRLVLVGDDPEGARALLALGRATWLAWPPDVEALRALLPLAPPAPGASPPPEDDVARKTPRRTAPANGAHDLRALLEELLAGAALRDTPSPRFHLKSGGACPVAEDRAALLEGLTGLIELARLCAGDDGLVRAALEPGGEGIRIGLDFPRAALTEKDLPTLFERATSGLEPPLAAGWDAARLGVERLKTLGARVALAGSEPGRVRCEVRLASYGKPAPKALRVGKPEDPFA